MNSPERPVERPRKNQRLVLGAPGILFVVPPPASAGR
jgi:hypothetical protein